ncbi:MAG: carboxymuconolactone decarboxylase [Acidocella sp. 20-57-95]|nr:MAG: carboxymuconolactone decarboxylase [Acidocella sp. 20-57-95]OYV58481.1 MAG: carboxymuconolactone decarboxylase [Acidocella sp. 21-58-7]HQT64741.1 carboxymuconolactone decarboxylase family protein [Acidocella sp.]HQU04939.1 carboxymuconolactone decarboxylase family protein [Acidocella sp.]
MITNWQDLINNMNGGIKTLRQGAPDIMKSFGEMAKAAHGGEALEAKTKELIALALGVAARCAPCIAYHAEAAAKLGASREQVLETMAMAIYMGAGPSVMYAAEALEAFDQMAAKTTL